MFRDSYNHNSKEVLEMKPIKYIKFMNFMCSIIHKVSKRFFKEHPAYSHGNDYVMILNFSDMIRWRTSVNAMSQLRGGYDED